MKEMVRLLVLAALSVQGIIFAQTAEEIFASTGISNGVCAHLGCGDGSLSVTLHNGGRMAVSAIAVNESSLNAVRQKIVQQGLMGLVDVDIHQTFSPLPYATSSISLLVADLGALGASAPSDTEIGRVLSPSGAAYCKRGGAWTVLRGKKPAEYDEWGHRFYGPEGNPISSDAAIKPPMDRVRWLGGSYLGMGQEGVAVGEGVVVTIESAARPDNGGYYYRVRDALNGVYLWERRVDRLQQLYRPVPIIAEGKVIFAPRDSQPLTWIPTRPFLEFDRPPIFRTSPMNPLKPQPC